MALDQNATVKIENARIILRNFAGKEGPMNAPGDRNFCVVIEDPALADEMAKDGWPLRQGKENEEGELRDPFLPIKVGYKGRPPKVVMLSSRGRQDLGEDEVEMLDWVQFKTVDIIFRPYFWNVGPKTGIKAYLKSGFFTIEEDELDLKYADVPDVKAKTRRGDVDDAMPGEFD